MASTAARDAWISEKIGSLLEAASEPHLTALSADVRTNLEHLFETRVQGYREILLTVLVAMLRYPEYRSSEALYDCNPRPIYEKGLRPVLDRAGIPCSQSCVLNIAKATPALDASWAAQRSGVEALDVLRLVAHIEQSEDNVELCALALVYRFKQSAAEIVDLRTPWSSQVDLGTLVNLCIELVLQAPDGGNTPQRICGLLLKRYHHLSPLEVYGVTDSASTTNLTSNKPGDLSVVEPSGGLHSVYEVTVKRFDAQRISECTKSLRSFEKKYGKQVSNVRVLCRQADAPDHATFSGQPVGLFLGATTDQGLAYEFLDIFSWIAALLFSLSDEQRVEFSSELQDYVDHHNTSTTVKRVYKALVD